MKAQFPVLCLSLLMSSVSYADCSDASKQAALSFMNSYLASFETDPEHSDQWVADNQQLTQSFKTAYKKLIEEARKKDPELGLGFDPIIDAQDSSEKFDTVSQCNEKSGVLLVSGLWSADSEERMEVAVKPIKAKGQWLIEGAGVINIPKKQRAPRKYE